MDNMMKEMKTGVFTYNGESYTFDFKTSLFMYEKQMFVRTVTDNLVGNDGYDVVIRDLIFDFVTIEMFTNIDTSFVKAKDEDGEDINPIIIVEHFLEETNVADIVKSNMEAGLLDELNHAIDLNIQYLTGIHPNPLNEAIANLVSSIDEKIGEFDLSSMMDMAKKFAGMTEDFTLDNIVDAYMNSDAHTKNLEEAKEAKESKEK
jgi:hypothetical protein